MSDARVQLHASIARWKTCPVCAGALEASISEPGASAHLECASCGRPFYANPKPTVSVLAEDSAGRLLLGRRGIEPFKGAWDTPGGFMEAGEGAEQTALREIEEETGVRGTLGVLLGSWPDTYGSEGITTINIFFAMRIEDPDAVSPASDVSELRWFEPHEVPGPDELAFDCVPAAVARWREWREQRT